MFFFFFGGWVFSRFLEIEGSQPADLLATRWFFNIGGNANKKWGKQEIFGENSIVKPTNPKEAE